MNLTKIVSLMVFICLRCVFNAPVYKIILSQKQHDQFLQYEIEVPPLSEFTFCTWVRFYEFEHDQSIFTYIVNGSKSVLSLWLESGGKYLKVNINEKVSSKVPVEIEVRTWRHICLTYQAEYAAWAIYINSHLIHCKEVPSLKGGVLPENGTIILGNGVSDGNANGMEGEIFGASMILTSSIEGRRANPLNLQISLSGSKQEGEKIMKGLTHLFRNVATASHDSKNIMNKQNNINVVGFNINDLSSKQNTFHSGKTTGIKDFEQYLRGDTKSYDNFSMIIEQFGSSTQELPTVSEFEKPPPVKEHANAYEEENLQVQVPPNPQPFISKYELTPHSHVTKLSEELSDMETPPPPRERDNKVYGQWTFSNSVLKYLKSINFKKKTPPTIPQIKFSDSFPYPSTINSIKVKLPHSLQTQFGITGTSRFNERSIKTRIMKRDVMKPQINVRILQENSRENILKLHANTKPMNVEITFRGETNIIDHAFRSDDREFKNENSVFGTLIKTKKLNDVPRNGSKNSKRNSKFLSTKLYPEAGSHLTMESQDFSIENVSDSNDIYIKSLSHINAWRKAKPFNSSLLKNANAIVNKPYQRGVWTPSQPIKSNFMNYNKFFESHEIGETDTLQTHKTKNYLNDALKYIPNISTLTPHSSIDKTENNSNLNGYDKQVETENKFNTRQIIDNPDIHLSQLNTNKSPVTTSAACKNLKLYDELYSKQNINTLYISSLIRNVNSAIDFIFHSNMMCSLEKFEANNGHMFLFQWNFTPVKVIGDAQPKKFTFCDTS